MKKQIWNFNERETELDMMGRMLRRSDVFRTADRKIYILKMPF